MPNDLLWKDNYFASSCMYQLIFFIFLCTGIIGLGCANIVVLIASITRRNADALLALTHRHPSASTGTQTRASMSPGRTYLHGRRFWRCCHRLWRCDLSSLAAGRVRASDVAGEQQAVSTQGHHPPIRAVEWHEKMGMSRNKNGL